MIRMITLNKVTAATRNEDTDDVTEGAAAEAIPVTINTETIRCFYPRRGGAETGTRITFTDGGGFAVAETVEQVHAALLAAEVISVPPLK